MYLLTILIGLHDPPFLRGGGMQPKERALVLGSNHRYRLFKQVNLVVKKSEMKLVLQRRELGFALYRTVET